MGLGGGVQIALSVEGQTEAQESIERTNGVAISKPTWVMEVLDEPILQNRSSVSADVPSLSPAQTYVIQDLSVQFI